MKFSELQAGKAAERTASFPHPFVAGDTIPVLFVPLNGHEEADALAFAHAFATERKVKSSPGEPLFDLALMAATITRGVFDPQSHVDRRERFFANEQEALSLSREAITYLYEHQQSWQDELSPTVKNLGQADIIATIVRLSEEDDPSGFIRLSPGLRWICTRTMAGLLVNSPMGKSSLGSDSEPDSKMTGSDKKSEGESL